MKKILTLEVDTNLSLGDFIEALSHGLAYNVEEGCVRLPNNEKGGYQLKIKDGETLLLKESAGWHNGNPDFWS